MKLRLEKGTYRYRTAHKKRQLFFVVLFILAIVAQLILRNFITEQIYKNLVTISAILTVLPMANLASPLVVAARIPEVPAEFHDACVPYEEKFPILYDLIITSNDLIMPVDAAVVHPTGVYDIPIANNKATADFMISSPLMNETYDHRVINFHEAIADRAKTL